MEKLYAIIEILKIVAMILKDENGNHIPDIFEDLEKDESPEK